LGLILRERRIDANGQGSLKELENAWLWKPSAADWVHVLKFQILPNHLMFDIMLYVKCTHLFFHFLTLICLPWKMYVLHNSYLLLAMISSSHSYLNFFCFSSTQSTARTSILLGSLNCYLQAITILLTHPSRPAKNSIGDQAFSWAA